MKGVLSACFAVVVLWGYGPLFVDLWGNRERLVHALVDLTCRVWNISGVDMPLISGIIRRIKIHKIDKQIKKTETTINRALRFYEGWHPSVPSLEAKIHELHWQKEKLK